MASDSGWSSETTAITSVRRPIDSSESASRSTRESCVAAFRTMTIAGREPQFGLLRPLDCRITVSADIAGYVDLASVLSRTNLGGAAEPDTKEVRGE
jgi:hypothetical protein